jgi:type IV secretion system protein VirB5
MQRRLLASLAIGIGLAASGSPPARAAEVVVDVQSELSLVQQVQTAINQLSMMQQQYNQLVQTYQQVAGQFSMLTTFANPNGLAQELEQPFLRNPMPNSSSLPGAITGTTAPTTAFSQQFLSANRVYTAPATTPSGQMMNTQAASLASIAGMVMTNLQSIEQRIAGLGDLQAQLNGATTIQQVASVNARIGAEQNFISAQQAQATNLGILATTQVAAQQQAQQQMVSQQAAQTAAAFPVSVP